MINKILNIFGFSIVRTEKLEQILYAKKQFEIIRGSVLRIWNKFKKGKLQGGELVCDEDRTNIDITITRFIHEIVQANSVLVCRIAEKDKENREKEKVVQKKIEKEVKSYLIQERVKYEKELEKMIKEGKLNEKNVYKNGIIINTPLVLIGRYYELLDIENQFGLEE